MGVEFVGGFMRQHILGLTVTGKIDRPLGSSHPDYPDLVYKINYGFVDGIMGGDGQEQDAYILGANEPLESFEGKVIAIYHRTHDVEDKWIVSLDDKIYSDEEILQAIQFQEQYYEGILVR
jgi:inorganic pyrophosphatase